MGLQRAISAPISMPETFFDPSSFNVISLLLVQEIQIYTNSVLFPYFDAFYGQQISGSLPWDANLQNIYTMECQQGRSIPSQLQTFTGR